MKKLLTMIALAGLMVAFSGCSSNKEELESILADQIEITKPKQGGKIGVGQLVIASVDIKSNKKGLSYLWTDGNGFSSNKDTLGWFPSVPGKQEISLVLRNGNQTKELRMPVTVYECDYRLCFWGQKMADIIVNELAYSAYYFEKINKPITSGLPEFIAFQDTETPNLLYAYVLDEQLKSAGGIEVYSISHDVDASDLESYNVYLQDYEQHKKSLISKYGQPITDENNYKYDFTDKSPKYLGYNVVFGSCVLKTTFSAKNSSIILQMKNGNKYGTATINVVYKKK